MWELMRKALMTLQTCDFAIACTKEGRIVHYFNWSILDMPSKSKIKSQSPRKVVGL